MNEGRNERTKERWNEKASLEWIDSLNDCEILKQCLAR